MTRWGWRPDPAGVGVPTRLGLASRQPQKTPGVPPDFQEAFSFFDFSFHFYGPNAVSIPNPCLSNTRSSTSPLSREVETLYNGKNNAKILEDAFEALIGVISLEFGEYSYQSFKKFISKVFEDNLDIVNLIKEDTNYKDRLMRHYHKNFSGKFPLYTKVCEEINEKGKVLYTYSCSDPNGKPIAIAQSFNKRVAEQQSAKKALEIYGLLSPEELTNE